MTRKMKDSRVEWIGEIPEDWHIKRLRFLCGIKTGNKDTINAKDDGIYPFYVRSPKIEKIDSFAFEGEAILMAGDGVGAGKVFHYVKGKFDYHQRVYNLHDFKGVNAKYLFYYLRENFYKEIEKSNAKSTVDSIRLPMLLNFPVILPGVDERKIVDYLDNKCSRIDEVMAMEKQLVEKLKDYKQSMITEAVTKGLNSKVKLKASGIEWIGDIPEHWSICRLKNYATICNGQDYKNVVDDDGIFPAIGSGGEFSKTVRFLYDKPSVLLGRKGTVDKPLYVDYPFWTVDTMYYTIIKEKKNVKFFFYLCKTIRFDYYQYGSAVPSMTQRDLNNIIFTMPSFEEQQQIADYLDKKCTAIDSTIVLKEKLIEKLDEYKKSLIYECVTGKRTV